MFTPSVVAASSTAPVDSPAESPTVVDGLRRLARHGSLAPTYADADACQRDALTRAAYTVAWPVVFSRLTRPVELRRGHLACATAISRLADECLDGFHDDVEAAVADLLTNAAQPIDNVEGWIAARLQASTIDAFRRRRGQRGALQRPRPPQWLRRALGDNPWLVDLAVQVLLWVGCPATAGAHMWPLESWAQRRGKITGDLLTSDTATVQREVEVVLAAMRTHQRWYDAYVERPLGRKQAPLALPRSDGDGNPVASDPLRLTDPCERDDAVLLDLAAEALARMRHRLSCGEPAATAVPEVLRDVFTEDNSEYWDLDRPPQGSTSAYDEMVLVLLADPTAVERLTGVVQQILSVAEPPVVGPPISNRRWAEPGRVPRQQAWLRAVG